MKSTAVFLAVIILLGTVCGPLALVGSLKFPVADGTQLYNYTFIYHWNFTGSFVMSQHTLDQAKADAVQGMNKEAAQQFSVEMVRLGHWYRIDSVDSVVDASNFRIFNIYGAMYDYNGTTTVNFDTDLASLDTGGWQTTLSSPLVQKSPMLLSARLPVMPLQGWEEAIIGILIAIAAAITPAVLEVFLFLVIVVALGIIAFYVSNNGGISSIIAPGLAGEIITAIIAVGVVVAFILVLPGLVDRYLPRAASAVKRRLPKKK